VGLQVIWGSDAPFYSGHARIGSAIDLIRSSYEGDATRRFASFRATDRAIGAVLPRDARVLLHMVRPSLGIDRDVLLDWPGQQGLILYEGIHGLRGLYDLYRSVGVTHLVWSPGSRPSPTLQEEVLFTDFVHRFGKDVRDFGRESLAALPSEAPPPDRPYRVLALGLAGYADGLYPIEAMKTYEPIPGNRESFAPPATPLPREPSAQADLAAQADAVCVADAFRADPLLDDRVKALFEQAVAYPRSFAVHVRRDSAP